MKEEDMPIMVGDIVGIRESGIYDLATRVVNICCTPSNELFHYGIITQYIKDLDDWLIAESIVTGVRFQLIKQWYTRRKSLVRVFRVNNVSPDKRLEAASRVYRYANTKYDYPLIFNLIRSGVPYWFKKIVKEHKLCRIRAEDLPWEPDRRFVCTELATRPYADLGIYIVPKGVVPIPSSLREAEIRGRLKLVYEFDPK